MVFQGLLLQIHGVPHNRVTTDRMWLFTMQRWSWVERGYNPHLPSLENSQSPPWATSVTPQRPSGPSTAQPTPLDAKLRVVKFESWRIHLENVTVSVFSSIYLQPVTLNSLFINCNIPVYKADINELPFRIKSTFPVTLTFLMICLI